MQYIIVLFILLLQGCIEHHEEKDFDFQKLNKGVEELKGATPVNGIIELQWWSVYIHELNPKSIRKTDQGIFIQLESFLVQESGIFIPANGVNVEANESSDPSFRLLRGNIYSYNIEG